MQLSTKKGIGGDFNHEKLGVSWSFKTTLLFNRVTVQRGYLNSLTFFKIRKTSKTQPKTLKNTSKTFKNFQKQFIKDSNNFQNIPENAKEILAQKYRIITTNSKKNPNHSKNPIHSKRNQSFQTITSHS